MILFFLLTGFLPFDEELLPALFKKIRESDYMIPSYVSNEAADLLRCMLQPEPTKRIKFDRIKNHPWFSDMTPLYVQMSLESTRSSYHHKIDDEILQRMMRMEFNFHSFSENQIKESIMAKKDYSFVIGYDLLVNDKIKSEIATTQSNKMKLI